MVKIISESFEIIREENPLKRIELAVGECGFDLAHPFSPRGVPDGSREHVPTRRGLLPGLGHHQADVRPL